MYTKNFQAIATLAKIFTVSQDLSNTWIYTSVVNEWDLSSSEDFSRQIDRQTVLRNICHDVR